MRILMVCLGNICRSPLAHGVFQHLIEQEGLDWTVDSAGTGSWHVGEAPDKRAIRTARENGIDISGQRAQHFQEHLFDRFDHILVMDRNNLKDVLALAKTPEHRSKVSLFMGDDIVRDPYYDDMLFDLVFRQIYCRSEELIQALRQ